MCPRIPIVSLETVQSDGRKDNSNYEHLGAVLYSGQYSKLLNYAGSTLNPLYIVSCLKLFTVLAHFWYIEFVLDVLIPVPFSFVFNVLYHVGPEFFSCAEKQHIP